METIPAESPHRHALTAEEIENHGASPDLPSRRQQQIVPYAAPKQEEEPNVRSSRELSNRDVDLQALLASVAQQVAQQVTQALTQAHSAEVARTAEAHKAELHHPWHWD